MLKVWERAIFQGSEEALAKLDCRATNRHPTAVRVQWELQAPDPEGVFFQPNDQACALGAVRNAGSGKSVPKNAEFRQVARAVGGTVLSRCLDGDAVPRGNVPHLIFTYDDMEDCTTGYLLPYCRTHLGTPHCTTPLPQLKEWLRTYDTLVLLYYHATGNANGHYVTLKRAGAGQWDLLCSVCGRFRLPSEVATLLLLRGAAAVIGVA